MCTEQKYDPRANAAPNSESTAGRYPQTPALDSGWQHSYLREHLQVSGNPYEARLMVRAWFLSHSLQEEGQEVLNPCSKQANAYLFELLDSFLSDLAVGKGETK